jgi:ATP-dependent exoDNAse (exonuclease V) alpha subunit
MLTLNDEQLTAYEYIIHKLKYENIFLLKGSAGVGKTTITKNICNYYINMGRSICAIAPTHKSKRVISNVLNYNKILPIIVFTVASLLGKIKEHSYVGSKSFSKANDKKFQTYSIFILDEVSMVSNKDLKFIINYINKYNKKLIIIGDEYQIPCPSAEYIVLTDVIEKENSFIFNDKTITSFELTKIVRQCENSPILKLAYYVRDHINHDFDMMDTNYEYIIEKDDIYIKFVELLKLNPFTSKIIAYTNQSVRNHNIEIRNCLQYENIYEINDILTGYNNLGWPELIIENGLDYVISKVIKINNHTIDNYINLSGYLLNLNIINTEIIISDLFFININDDNNTLFINELIKRGEQINKPNSTKADFIKYNNMKNKVIFMENIYKFNGEIYTETDFKEKHALLTTKVTDVIKEYNIIKSKLTEKINSSYENIIDKRLNDNKNISDSETLADQYQVIEKDIYYGYAITSHKSQGSTYDNVIVDDCDFQKMQNRFNYKYNKMESRIKEKNQLRYVAFTRARKNLYVLCESTTYI